MTASHEPAAQRAAGWLSAVGAALARGDEAGLAQLFRPARTGELRNMWTRTGQPGLWFTAGSFPQARIYSRLLALQIDAVETGRPGARRHAMQAAGKRPPETSPGRRALPGPRPAERKGLPMQKSPGAGPETATIRAGLVGRGIGLSRTPAMHEAEGRALGIDYSYGFFDMDDAARAGSSLAGIIETAEAQGFGGLNVTYPYKIEATRHLHALSDDARAVGAVNTIVFRAGRRVGHNTDLWGFAEGFRQGMDGVPLGNVLLLGAGGAGSAVALALLSLGVQRLWVFDIDAGRADTLARALGARFGAGRAAAAADPENVARCLDGVVNASPVGMAKLPGSPFPAALLRPGLWVVDIVYFPLETELLAAARAAGCRVLPGSGMAVWQAVRAFELFTGRRPDPARMRRTFEAMGR